MYVYNFEMKPEYLKYVEQVIPQAGWLPDILINGFQYSTKY